MPYLFLFLLLFPGFSLASQEPPSLPVATRELSLWLDRSPRQALGQLMMVTLRTKEANEETKRVLQELRPGGVMLHQFYNALTSQEQIIALTRGLQRQAQELGIPPLLFAIDQEGGRVGRLMHLPLASYSARELAQRGERAAYEQGHRFGLKMRELGIHWNFAPCVDLDTPSSSAILGERTFSSDPKTVCAMASAFVAGSAKAGVITTLKHFPGLGRAKSDTHKFETAINLEEVSSWMKEDLLPYATIKTPSVMVGHVKIPLIDAQKIASCSKIIIEELLRKQLGFQGVVVSDSLTMRGFAPLEEIATRAPQALKAGCDLLLFGGFAREYKEGPLEHYLDVLDQLQRSLEADERGGEEPLLRLRVIEALARLMQLKREFCAGSVMD